MISGGKLETSHVVSYRWGRLLAMAMEPLRWDTPGLTWDGGWHWDQLVPGPSDNLPPSGNININTITKGMEYWEVTKERAQASLPVWREHTPALRITLKGPDELEDHIDEFEPLVQLRTTAQDTYDAAYRAAQASLQKMKILGTKVPAIIEAMLDEDEGIIGDVNDLYANTPRTEASVLKRARELHPVWVRANARLAAMVPAQAAITRPVSGVAQTAALLKAELDGYTNLIKAVKDTQEALDKKRMELRNLDRTVDQLCKRWYKAAKALFDEGSAGAEALEGIPTEGGTPAPEVIEIDTVLQGGEDGLQVLVTYLPGGGDHATTKSIKWQVVGTDADFVHSAPLEAIGNALGPFAQGTTVRIITEVTNSVGVRTTAPRTITLGPPII